MNHCVRHFEESMEATCRTCGAPFCGRCLVFAFGPKKPPYCIGCALSAGGVRNNYRPVSVAPPTSGGRQAVKAAKAAANPIAFEETWSDQEEEHDARVPATAQLARIMRSRPSDTVGQAI